jgi:hypothetical protein
MFASTHSARRLRAKRYQKAAPEHWRTVRALALQLSRADYVEYIKAAG